MRINIQKSIMFNTQNHQSKTPRRLFNKKKHLHFHIIDLGTFASFHSRKIPSIHNAEPSKLTHTRSRARTSIFSTIEIIRRRRSRFVHVYVFCEAWRSARQHHRFAVRWHSAAAGVTGSSSASSRKRNLRRSPILRSVRRWEIRFYFRPMIVFVSSQNVDF